MQYFYERRPLMNYQTTKSFSISKKQELRLVCRAFYYATDEPITCYEYKKVLEFGASSSKELNNYEKTAEIIEGQGLSISRCIRRQIGYNKKFRTCKESYPWSLFGCH